MVSITFAVSKMNILEFPFGGISLDGKVKDLSITTSTGGKALSTVRFLYKKTHPD